MGKDKVLTRNELIKILKDMGIATKKDLGSLERRLVVKMNKMEKGLRQSIADLAETTPTRQEFEELKQRVSGKYGLI